MYTKQDLKSLSADIVYLKPVETSQLPADVREQAGDLETLFAVHNGKGEQVALVANPLVASHLADQNNLTVVSLH